MKTFLLWFGLLFALFAMLEHPELWMIAGPIGVGVISTQIVFAAWKRDALEDERPAFHIDEDDFYDR